MTNMAHKSLISVTMHLVLSTLICSAIKTQKRQMEKAKVDQSMSECSWRSMADLCDVIWTWYHSGLWHQMFGDRVWATGYAFLELQHSCIEGMGGMQMGERTTEDLLKLELRLRGQWEDNLQTNRVWVQRRWAGQLSSSRLIKFLSVFQQEGFSLRRGSLLL